MKRPILQTTFVLILAAVLGGGYHVAAGEQPGPGLEIIDGATGIDSGSSPITTIPPAPIGTVPYQPVYTDPVPAPVPADSSTWSDPYVSDPFADPYQTTPYTVDPGVPAISAPYTDPAATAQTYDDPFAVDQTADGELEPVVVVSIYPQDPYATTLNRLNTRNRNFPGLAEAASQGNLRGAADIIWGTLRQRRIVDATLSRGPGASAGVASPYDVQMALEAINYRSGASAPQDTPTQASARVNAVINAFEQPTIDDVNVGAAMEQALMRLYSDIYAIRVGMFNTTDDGLYLELAKTYVRAATSCDFFIFERKQLVTDINSIMKRTYGMFFPDGASAAGDVGGVTGNLFQTMLMIDYFSRDDTWFRRDTRNAWRSLEVPSQYLVNVACPDQSLPRFGPRGSRELTPMEVAALDAMFPKSVFRTNRIGLASSHSYPDRSDQTTYGGVYVTRSGPEASARYMAMRMGPLGDLNAVPPHFDFGSMVVMSRNIKFIVDPAGYGGDAAAAAAHSTLSLSGQHVIPSTYNEPGVPVDAVWRTNASMDYLTDKAGFGDGKTWQRSMVYVKDLPGETRSDYWLLLDHIDMQNDPEPRRVNIRFQLAPGINAYHDGSGIMATASHIDSSALRIFAIDGNSELTVSEGSLGMFASHIFDSSGGSYAAPAVNLLREIVGDTTTATLLYPSEDANHRPVRIERDADIIRGRTGAVVIDHGQERIDVIAWAPPGTELVTPTLNLQLAADLAVFRIRNGKIARINFVNLERFQAKEPDGGIWSMRVNGPAQTLTIEPEAGGGWQILSDPANRGSASLYDVNFGPAVTRSKVNIRPGDMRVVFR